MADTSLGALGASRYYGRNPRATRETGESLQGPRVLLVGGSGFLGSHVARLMQERGARVTSLSRSGRAPHAGMESLAADRRDPSALTAVLEGRHFDFTVDLAAYDAAGVEILLGVPGAAFGRYVLVSSGQVYLVTRDPRPPFREEDSDRPIIPEPLGETYAHANWIYGIGKRRAEEVLLALRRSRGVQAQILRIPILQGDGDASLRLWGWIERLLDGGPLVVPEDGAQPVRHLLAADAAALLVRWLEGPAPREIVYNFSPVASITLRELLEIAASTLGVSPRFAFASFEELAAAGLPASTFSYASRWGSVLDPSRAVEEFGLVPRPVRDYLPEVVRAHVTNRPARSDESYALRAVELDFVRARSSRSTTAP